MALKLRRREDLKTQNYYINGTFNHNGKTLYIKNKSTKQNDKNLAKLFLEYYEEQMRNDVAGKKDPTFEYTAKLKMKDDYKPTSIKTDIMIKKIITKIGDIKLSKISNEFIRKIGSELYPIDKNILYASDTDLSEQEKLKKSSRQNTINRCVISPISLVLHYGAKQTPPLCDYLVVDRYKILDRPPIYFTYDEFDRCLEIKAIFQIKLLLVFLCYTGARLQEALNVKWSDIKETNLDPDGTKNYEMHLWEGKGDKGRNIYIHPRLKKWLDKINNKGVYIFQWRKAWDNKKDSEGLYFNWREMLKNADIELNKLPHKCRHTFATWGRKKGWTLEDLKEVGGWKDRKSVEVYSHIMPETKISRIKELPDQKIMHLLS